MNLPGLPISGPITAFAIDLINLNAYRIVTDAFDSYL
jgi:hypothetical protein